MREIKFRAWDKVLGQMEYDFTAIEFDIFSQKDNEWQDSISKISYIRNENWQTDSNTIKELVIMQFTGLIDKNGKEIYEGDIVKWSSWKIGFKHLDGTEIKFTLKKVNWDEKEGRWRLNDDIWNLGIYENIEIIGNIYESSHLLDK